MSIANTLLPNPKMLKDIQILVIDNDQDSRNLYTSLLESDVTKIISLGSSQAALDFLDDCVPAIVIYGMSFLDEYADLLIQQVRALSLSSGRMIPILITSPFAPAGLAQELMVKVEAYLPKPINVDYFIDKVWDLILLSSIADGSGI